MNGRALAYPRGKTLGGSSAINAMISMRGQSADYDGWRELGLQGWGWDDVFPVFKRMEDHFLGPSEHHGVGGEWRVEAPRLQWAVLDRIADAACERGIPKVADFNTGCDAGVGYFHVNQQRGTRWSAARGFLKPVLGRANLRLETNVLVENFSRCSPWSQEGQHAKSGSRPPGDRGSGIRAARTRSGLQMGLRAPLMVRSTFSGSMNRKSVGFKGRSPV